MQRSVSQVSEYSDLQARKNALRDEIRAFKMSIDELYQRKRRTHCDAKEDHNDLDTAIAHHKYSISQIYKELAEIQQGFERLNEEAAERRSRKARRQE